MGDCEPYCPGADEWAGLKRVLGWAGVAAILGASGAASWAYLAGLPYTWPAVIGWGIGLVLGGSIGFAVEWFTRLKVQNPRTITMNGHIECAGKNSGLPLFGIADFDWCFNLGSLTVMSPAGLTVEEVRTRAAPGSGIPAAFACEDPSTHVPILHCEISSHIGDFSAAGTAIGAVAGAAAGAAIGAAVGCLVAGIFTFGLGCLIAILLGALIGAIAGAIGGGLIGAGIGAIADAVSDFDHKGEGIEQCCMVNFTGRWVTDIGHQHNEIHDVESAQIMCGYGSSSWPLISGAVGIGRIPTGRDP